jgi:hypothetical protein
VGDSFADIAHEGKEDLFVITARHGNVLFRNLGNGRFKDITKVEYHNLRCRKAQDSHLLKVEVIGYLV